MTSELRNGFPKGLKAALLLSPKYTTFFFTRTLAYKYSRTRGLSKYTPLRSVHERVL